MNVFYEEDGGFKVGTIMIDQDTSLHVESPHGKRSKIKNNSVLLRFDKPTASDFMGLAQGIAEKLDENFLWESSTPREFSFSELANDYFGHAPSAIEAAGILLRLHAAPIYFYKRGKGHYKAAPADALKSALAGVEKKRLLALKQDQYTQQLLRFELPVEYQPLIHELLYNLQNSTVEQKALAAASNQAGVSPTKLLEKCGAISSSHDYHLNRLLFEQFPDGIEFNEIEWLEEIGQLKTTDVIAFSIDDASTTEIDDAFSVNARAEGGWRIGIHIAAPALGFSPGSAIDAQALRRLSTIYFPSGKFTMLPPAVLQKFTLSEKQLRPVLSMYLDIDLEFSVLSTTTEIEQIYVAENLRREELESEFDQEKLDRDCSHHRWGDQLKILWKLANRLSARRGNLESNALSRVEYNIDVKDEHVSIVPRHRGSPIDQIVSELMIFVNTEWGRQLAENDVPGIFRSQYEGKVRMTMTPGPHQGLGVSQYLWASSPLRRYVDLVNQWQLISWRNGVQAPFLKNNEALLAAMRDFDLAYNAYNDFQRTMERYWCLRWMLQEKIVSMTATVHKENLVRFDSLPLYLRLPSLPDSNPGAKLTVAISNIDLLDLTFNCEFKGFVEIQTKHSVSRECDSRPIVT